MNLSGLYSSWPHFSNHLKKVLSHLRMLEWLRRHPNDCGTWLQRTAKQKEVSLSGGAALPGSSEDQLLLVLFHALSQVWSLWSPWTVACQTPLSMEFSRQEYWSGLPFPPPGDLPLPDRLWAKPPSLASPALAGGFFNNAPPEKPLVAFIKEQTFQPSSLPISILKREY